ncbi:MAG: inositol monophosphatase family protein [Steroidobacteraceae bacterium]
MHAFVNTAIRAARRAGEVIVRGLARFEGLTATSKGVNDYVTEVDKQAEAEVIDILYRAYPQHSFLGEEGGYRGSSDTVWIIDPLDGTTNFIHGFPHFAVSIACMHRERLEHAVIYDPMRQEIFHASAGAGAYLENKRIRVTKARGLQDSLIATGFPYSDNLVHIDAYLAMLKTVMSTTAGLRRPGAASLDLAYVACGRVDAFFEIGLKPWDTAAGTLLVTEAGGMVGTLDGSQYRQGGNICAGTPRVYGALLDAINPHLPEALRNEPQRPIVPQSPYSQAAVPKSE